MRYSYTFTHHRLSSIFHSVLCSYFVFDTLPAFHWVCVFPAPHWFSTSHFLFQLTSYYFLHLRSFSCKFLFLYSPKFVNICSFLFHLFSNYLYKYQSKCMEIIDTTKETLMLDTDYENNHLYTKQFQRKSMIFTLQKCHYFLYENSQYMNIGVFYNYRFTIFVFAQYDILNHLIKKLWIPIIRKVSHSFNDLPINIV